MLPTREDVLAAYPRVKQLAVRTPLLSNETLNKLTGAEVRVKAESLQRGGAFKIRGATNAIASLTEEQRKAGVVAYSSGNHAVGVSIATKHFNVAARIIMPSDAPAAKIEQTRANGAEVILYDRVTERREIIGDKLASQYGSVLVKPFDEAAVIAGQGSVGLEIGEEFSPDIVLAPASGAGLSCGLALALPDADIYAVEPEGHDDIVRSLKSQTMEINPPGIRSICDALLVDRMGEITFPLGLKVLAGALSASDGAARAAMRFAFEHLKLVLEPSGALALAALLSGAIDARGRKVAIIASGGNVDAAKFAEIIEGRNPAPS